VTSLIVVLIIVEYTINYEILSGLIANTNFAPASPENARASQKEGEGLGLYISKLLMEKMGGGLEAFNRNDGFSIRLWIRLS